jgi:membrane-associated phospholipid phosphatase
MLSALAVLLGYVLAGVAAMLGVATAAFVGWDRLAATRPHARERFRDAAPYLGLLLGVLLVNKVARDVVPEVSWLFGWNITPAIHGLEGALVADIQSLATPGLTAYFSFVYIFGYVFVLVFPFVAYFALPDLRPLKRAAVAYATNYSLGLVFYLLFVSYGPRNLLPDLVEPLLYSTYPQTQILTSQVNTNTNVFPSLHTSLSVTTATLAWTTRDAYPYWFATAAFFAVSIAVATMYLGIHWATDVVAGAVLGWVSVRAADRAVTWREGAPDADSGGRDADSSPSVGVDR